MWRLFIFWLKIKVGKIHIALGDDVKGQKTHTFGQLHFGHVGHDIPMVPLAPGDGLLVVFGCNNVNGRNQGLAV